MLPQVSVVIPCRDAAPWLAECLASLRQQQGVELELLLVDDGSRDGSAQLALNAWAGVAWPLRVLRSGGCGVSTARNLGWQAARYPLVAFLDADDLAFQDRLSRQAERLCRDRELMHVLCGWRRLDPSGRPLVDVRPWEEGAGFSLEEALRHKAVLPSAWMLRREALVAVGGFDASLSQAEDVDLLLRLARIKAAGAWLEEVLCGYRVHPAAASQQLAQQVQGLCYVVDRHLSDLPATQDHQRLAAEVRYGTRAWLGWSAWIAGDDNRALELWTTALGLSPFAPGLTWVHFAENVVHSAARIGKPSELDALLRSPLWQELERRWWRFRRAFTLQDQVRPSELDWQLVYQGQGAAALLAWGRQFAHDLQTRASSGPPDLSWRPAALAAANVPGGALGELKRALLRWSESLLALQGTPRPAAGLGVESLPGLLQPLQRDLAQILLRWAVLTWHEDRRATHQRLEQSLAMFPSLDALGALARLQRRPYPAGAQALQLLASRVDPQADDLRLDSVHPPVIPAFWEQDGYDPDQCRGPQCAPCLEQDLQGWIRDALPHQLIEWRPASLGSSSASVPAESRELVVLEEGQAWLRPPLENAWQTTHAFSIADRDGVSLPRFCRRYPQPWGASCPYSASSPEPRPFAVKPLRLEAPVLALVGLSAETYYHWLLEILPTLGWLQAARPELLSPELLIWHNGGSADYVQDTLSRCCGFSANQLLDAHQVPWIQARQLIAITPAPFARPSPTAQDWLRHSFLPGQSQPDAAWPSIPALWLRRGQAGHRPAVAEEQVLEQLQVDGVVSVDSATLSVRQQAEVVAKAKLLIAPHGGAMANMVFASSGATVLELHHPQYRPPYFQNLAQARGVRYLSQSQPIMPPSLYRDLFYESAATEPIVLDVDQVVSAVRFLMTPTHGQVLA